MRHVNTHRQRKTHRQRHRKTDTAPGRDIKTERDERHLKRNVSLDINIRNSEANPNIRD